MNGLYLEQLLQTNPEKLAKNTPGGPEIVGAVYVHPTAQVDPQAKVGLLFFVVTYRRLYLTPTLLVSVFSNVWKWYTDIILFFFLFYEAWT